MANDCMKANENIYFRCRKEAAKYNDKLNSRESASELLGVSVSSLADYELGNTKVVPVDKVVLMADLYNAPQLLNSYCARECPIGCRKDIATEIQPIERTSTLSFLVCFTYLQALIICKANSLDFIIKGLSAIILPPFLLRL